MLVRRAIGLERVDADLVGRVHVPARFGIERRHVTPRAAGLVEDVISAILHLFDTYDSPDLVNVGTGNDISVRELADEVARRAEYTGAIEWDTSRPDGMPRKLLDVSRLTKFGFSCQISLQDGIGMMFEEYRQVSLSR